MENRITLIIGGARSGKSAYALTEANRHGGRKAFIATAQALDSEMEARITRHKEERGADWDTFEEPLKLDHALRSTLGGHGAVVIDCLTLWVSNLLLAEHDTASSFAGLESALSDCKGSHIYIVSNEVGMGIVPEYALSRNYRDCLGDLNKLMARIASRVVFMVAGIPMEIKRAP